MVIMPITLRMDLPFENAGVIRGPAGPYARARREPGPAQLHGLELEPFLRPEHVPHRLALVHDVRDGRGDHIVGAGIGLEPDALRPEGERHRRAGPPRG